MLTRYAIPYRLLNASLTVGLGLLVATTAHAGVWYVDIGSPVANGDGTSWAQAFQDLPPAIDAAESAGDMNPEMWIATGPYDVPAGNYIDLTGRPFSQVTLRGGFTGNETAPEQRPAPSAVPPDTLDSGTRFVANFSNATRFIQTDLPVIIERINIAGFRNEGSGSFLNASNATVEVREVFCFGVEGSQLGGGISTNGSPSVIVEDSRFRANVVAGGAGGIGGVIFAGGSTVLTVRRSVFENCEARSGAIAQGNGGAIGLGGGIPNELNLVDCTFLRCSAAGQGGAISLFSSTTATIEGCRFVANESFLAAAIAVDGNGAETAPPVTVVDSEFVQHNAARTLSIRRSNLVLNGCLFTGNTSSSSFASVVDLLDTNATIEDTTFSANRNTASDGSGGAVRIHSEGFGTVGTTTFRRSNFTNNRAPNSGGAIFAEDINIAIEDSVFEGNSANQMGGAVSVVAEIMPDGDEVAPFVVTGSTFSANSADIAGGAIASDRELVVGQSTFIQNAGGFGGAIYLSDTAGFALENSVFAENTAKETGAAIAASFLVFQSSIGFSTFHENQAATGDGVVLAVTTGPALLTVSDNIFVESVTPVANFTTAPGTTVVNNLVAPGTVLGVDNQLEGAPSFLDATRGDFRLTNSANVEGLAMGDAAVDRRGASRPQGSGRDLGAYEFTPNEDRDGDRVPDILEGNGDADIDGTPDYLDNDNNPINFNDINNDGNIDAVDIQLIINAVLGV